MTSGDRPTRGERAALTIICFVGVALRLAWLFQPIRYDESFTFLYFVRGGLGTVLTNYDAPNNHVFHSLLVWLATRPSSAVWAIRLPAFVAGSLVPLAAYCVGRRLHGRRAALLGAAIVACAVHLIEYSTNARGYSLLTLFALLQVVLADRILRGGRHVDFALLTLVTALGFFTVPTMLYPTATTAVWAIVSSSRTTWRSLAWRSLSYATLTAALTIALYLPILLRPDGFENLTSNRWVAQERSPEMWLLAIRLLASSVLDEWSLGVTLPGLAVVGVLALIGSVVGVVRTRNARPAWILIAAVVLLAMCRVQFVAPFARVFCFALPMVLLAAAAGLAELLPARRVPLVAVGLCVALAAFVAIDRSPDRAAESDKFPDADAIVAFLSANAAAGDATIYDAVPSRPIQYALLRQSREPLGYRVGAARLWIVTRDDGVALDTMRSRTNRLSPLEFETPRLAFKSGRGRVYEATPKSGRTPERLRRKPT